MSMRALLLKKYGTPTEALSLETTKKPEIDDESDEMLVRVIAASIPPAEVRIIRGDLKSLGSIVPMKPLPTPIGIELTGIIEKLGKKANGFKTGDEIIGLLNFAYMGSMAEYAVTRPHLCGHKPANLSWEEASCIAASGLTALQALKLHNGAKNVAFIPGGLGGVGTFSVQLAKNYFGFKKVITTVSTSKVALIKEHIPNVDQVIDYRTQDITREVPPKSVDFILDQFGNVQPWLRYLNTSPSGPKPTIVGITTVPKSSSLEKGWETKLPWYVKGVVEVAGAYVRFRIPCDVHYDSIIAAANTEELEEVASIAGKGLISPVIAKVFPFEEAVQAYEMAKAGANGKIVVRVSKA